MTVSNQTPITITTANGSTSAFPYEFRIDDQDDLAVYLDGVLQSTGFTVDGLGNDGGGFVTFTTMPAADTEVITKRAMQAMRTENYGHTGDFRASTVNSDFDDLWMYEQQQDEEIDRCLQRDIDNAYYDGGARRIINLASGINDNDVVTKIQLDLALLGLVAGTYDLDPFVKTVDTMVSLVSTDPADLGDRVQLMGYHAAGDGGGDIFVRGTGVHNGGTIIDTNRAFPTDWTNSTQVAAWFDTSGGTVNAWHRINWSRLRTEMFGVLYNSDQDYAAVNTLALNALSTVLGGNILTQANGECVYNGWDLLEKKGFIVEGTGRAFGSVTPGSKLVFLPLTGEAIDMRNCGESKFRDFCLDGGWIQENDPGSVPGDYPDSVTSIGFQSSNATYVDYERLNILRFSKGIATDTFHATDSTTVFTINLYSVNFSACRHAIDYGYQCNNFNMFGGLITNCSYGVRWQNGGANCNFWGVDLQVQGYDQRAASWEEADSSLFDLTKNQQFGLHGCYVELNGNDYANGQQYLGELDQVQGFTIDNLYCASVTSMDPATAMINANDSVGIEVSGISPYNFPADMTWVNCTGTTNPVLVWGRNNVFHSGHRLVDNSFAPVLHLNGSAEAGVTYGANNEGMAIFDGTRITFKGLMEVTNWGSLTAGGYIGIELPTAHAPANILAAVMANGISYDAAGGTMYVARILPATSDTVRIFDASTLNAVTQTDAPAVVYFEISYEPFLGNI